MTEETISFNPDNITLPACIVDLIDLYIRPQQRIRTLLSEIDKLKKAYDEK